MKKLAFLLSLVMLISIALDRELYFYGRNYLKVWSPIPVSVTPQVFGLAYGNLGFVLVDEEEMTVVAPGTMYQRSDLLVDSILSYGFNDNNLYVIVSDVNKQDHLLEISESDNALNINVSIFSDNVSLPSNIHWIQIGGSESKVQTIDICRNISVLICLGLIIAIAILGVIKKVRSKMKLG